MKPDNYECAKIISYQFKRLHQNYVDMVSYLDGINHSIVPWQKSHEWSDGENGDSPIKTLNLYYFMWANDVINLVIARLKERLSIIFRKQTRDTLNLSTTHLQNIGLLSRNLKTRY